MRPDTPDTQPADHHQPAQPGDASASALAAGTLETARLLALGIIGVETHVRELLKRIGAHNDELNAFLHVAQTEALERARMLDAKRERGEQLGTLFGLCVGVKSNIAVRGLPLSCASETLRGFIAPYDADVIARVLSQDAIVLGMLNMDEFACGSSGESSAFFPTKNPAAPGRIPGGSSSGSAAAVAAGLCDLALGSDTGGSIRNPASHCGVVGIKPSYGRVSRYGLVDLAMTLDQIGPLSRDVDGAALLLHAIAGPSRNDARTIPLLSPFSPVPHASSRTHARLRVGIAPELQRLCTDSRIRAAVEDAAGTLAVALGGDVERVTLPHIDLAIQTYYPLVYVEFFSGTRKFDGRKYGKRIEDVGGKEVVRRIAGGMEISKAEDAGRHYRTALATKRLIAEEIGRAFERIDVLVSPVTPMLPHRLGEDISVEQMYAYDAFTIPANLSRCCAASVPLTRIDGVPVGLHLMCRSGDEEALIDAMRAWEQRKGV